MPFPAAQYNTLFTWMRSGTSQDATYGQSDQTYTANGDLWGWLEDEGFTSVTAVGSRSQALLHIRGLPAIVPADQFFEIFRGYTWSISGMRQDRKNKETIFEVTR